GTIIDVRVSVGDAVSAGQAVALMEAMKMEHTLTAPRDGIVASISTEIRAQVGEGDVLVALETD
ncbi:MAG: acetyl-CoA carboxylase biotin carboxyl carrier protein subunit, partial [Pseudomonadota bacterium]